MPNVGPVSDEAAIFHASVPVVDLVVGTALFRPELLPRRTRGHVDLPRLVAGGVDVVGFTIATRHPDRRGSLSTPHLWSLGVPTRSLRSDMAIANAIARRVASWAETSGGRLRLLRDRGAWSRAGVKRAGDGVEPAGVDAFLGVQGGHVLEADLSNVDRLHSLGVRMFSPAHVMDNDLVGSNTGVRGGGLTSFGREVVGELERAGIVVDLAHMSEAGIRGVLPILTRPFVVSHTGLRRLSGGTSRIPRRRFTPGNRNLSDSVARDVAQAGGVIGLTLSSRLLGGEDLDAIVRAVDAGLELAGPTGIALGSDLDGGLRAIVDIAGLPWVTERLLASGMDRPVVAGFLGGNALRVLRDIAG
ncbi:MAG: membrane dipeptidase [Candidatus Limnocylindrales bacterium]